MIQGKIKYSLNVLTGFIGIVICFCMPVDSRAQPGEQNIKAHAQQLIREGQYEKALPALRKLFGDAPFDKEAYSNYLDALIKTQNYPLADSVVHYMMQIRRNDPALWIDLGKIEVASGHQKEAKKYFDKTLEALPSIDFQIKGIADDFANANLPEYSIKTYLQARTLSGNPYAYATELALLYNQTGDRKAALNALLDKAMTQVGIMDDLQAALLQVIATDKNGLKEIQKSLNDRLKQNPNNPVWQQLLSWTYTQNGDYKGALKSLISLDETFQEQGKRLLPFTQNAIDAGQYDVALQAYDYILKLGTDKPYYQPAAAGKLACSLAILKNQLPPNPKEVALLLKQFQSFFDAFPQYKNHDLWRQYAMVEARYHNQPDTAIALLQQVVGNSSTLTEFQGWCKLDMGDDYLLSGKIWEATLLYSQVNKAFEQDELGEIARFKNAKWAFYNGDFKLAQEQLSVLKASTSRLIANDALYLSVLITENTPTDSNMTPLQRFAAADLLLFKHQTTAADQLLDSIAKAWTQSPLQDDIAMLRAKTAEESGHWDIAQKYYKIVLEQYGDDILGDDAAWSLAELFRKKIKDNQKAAEYYKMVLMKYPGSTFAQEARKRYRELSGKEKEPET